MLKKLLSNSLIYGLAPQVSKIAGIFALPVITKDLTATDFGIWGIVMAYIGSLQALNMLGMGVVLSNAFFKMPCQYKWLWRQIYGFLSIWIIPFSALVGVILYLIMPIEIGDNAIALISLLLLPNIIFGPTTLLGTFYYQLGQNPTPIAIRTAVFGLLTITLNLYTISYLKMGYMGWAWSSFVVTLLMNFSYWVPLNLWLGYTPIFNFKWRTIRNSFEIGVPTIPHQYSGFLLNSSDRIVLDQLNTSTSNLGEYNLASQFGNYFQQLFGAANQAVSPMMLKSYKNKNDLEARNLIFVLQILGLAGTFFFCLWSKEIFFLLIKNKTLSQTYPLAIIIIMAHNYRPMYIGAMNKLFYLEKTALLWRVSFIAGASNLLLNFIFVPLFGFAAAAYTTFGSLMYLGFSGFFIKKIREVQEVNYYPIFWLTTIVCLTALVYFLVELAIKIKILISLILIVSSIFLLLKNKYLN